MFRIVVNMLFSIFAKEHAGDMALNVPKGKMKDWWKATKGQGKTTLLEFSNQNAANQASSFLTDRGIEHRTK